VAKLRKLVGNFDCLNSFRIAVNKYLNDNDNEHYNDIIDDVRISCSVVHHRHIQSRRRVRAIAALFNNTDWFDPDGQLLRQPPFRWHCGLY
jgi:hypothetical protein